MHTSVSFLGRRFPDWIFKPSNKNVTKHKELQTNKDKKREQMFSNDKFKTRAKNIKCVSFIYAPQNSFTNSNNNDSSKPHSTNQKMSNVIPTDKKKANPY